MLDKEHRQESEADRKLNKKSAEIIVKSIGLVYAVIHVYNTLSFYASVTTSTDLIEVAVAGGALGYAESHKMKLEAKKEVKEVLDSDALDEIFDETVKEHPEIKALVTEIEIHCKKVYSIHYERLKKGISSLENENVMEDAFLALHKLNFLAVDRFFTKQLIKDKDDKAMLALVMLKNTLTAGIQSASSLSKETSLAAGCYAGRLMADLEDRMKAKLDERYRDIFDKNMHKLGVALSYLSPVTYAIYQVYKVTTKLLKGGCKAVLLPVDAITVVVSGFLAGLSDTALEGKGSGLIATYNISKEQSWGEISMAILSSCTGLYSNIMKDLATSYNNAIMKREKFIDAMSKGEMSTGLELKPHKEGRELLLYTMMSQEISQKETPWYQKPIVKFGSIVPAALRAILGVSAKYTYKGSVK